MAERLIAPVSKTGELKSSVGSNPTISARIMVRWLSGLKHLPAKKAVAQKVARGFKSHSHRQNKGNVSEWFKVPPWKGGIPERVSWVRIPPFPPQIKITCQK
jgi:hypothetical protein